MLMLFYSLEIFLSYVKVKGEQTSNQVVAFA